jgi:hypothetical protein
MWHDLIPKGDLQAARKKLNLENEFLISFQTLELNCVILHNAIKLYEQ